MSTERFVEVREDGTIWLQEDNDGWTFVNRGSEPREWQVELDHKHKSLKSIDGNSSWSDSEDRLYNSAMQQLKDLKGTHLEDT